MITDFEKQIYNNHLVVSRKIKGEPFKLRKDFSKLDDEKLVSLQKLSRFFKNHPQVNQDDFFISPHMVYPEKDNYSLDFYTRQPAVKCYTLHMKQLEIQDPDSKESLERLQKSLKFVYDFCKENRLNLEDYELNMEESVPRFVSHLKNHKINYYTLHALTFSNPKLDSRILDFIFSDFYGTFQKTKNKFFASKKMREFSKQAKQKITTKLKIN